MGTYITRHLQVLFATLGDFRRTPLTSLNTVLVIGITLLLPTMLFIVVKSAAQLSDSWQGQPQVSIFLQDDIDADEAQLIFNELKLHPAITLAEYISPDQALQEFKTISGLDFELDLLDENPLPASVVVMPSAEYQPSDKLMSLRDDLAKIEGIADIRLDLDWTDKFIAILHSVSRFAMALSVLLGIALTLIVSNTIKLLILNRRHEIEITKLVGGSDRFVRRPFLYFGAMFGIFGALTMLAMLALMAHYMAPNLAKLASLYNQESLLYRLNWSEIISLIGIGAGLGWLAARTAVARHLGAIKPR